MQKTLEGIKCETVPSVVKDYLTVRMSGEERKRAELMVFDSDGNKLFSGEFTHEITINVREFSRGRYIGFIHSGINYQVIRFRKE